MPVEVIMPQLGLNMIEGTLVEWLKSEGEACQKGEVIAVIETDKALADLEAPAEGLLSQQAIGPGDTVPVGTVIAYIRGRQEPVLLTEEAVTAESGQSPDVASTPGARRLARDRGVQLGGVAPGRPGGRVTEEDVQRFLEASQSVSKDEVPTKPLEATTWTDETPDPIRRATARKMEEARTIPHFYIQTWADVTHLAAGPAGETTKLNRGADDVLIYACAKRLRQRPEMLSAWIDGRIRRHREVNIGFAVQTSYGLVVPVIRNADLLDSDALAEQRNLLVEKARKRELSVDDVGGGTFTITNLGVFNVELAWPLINPPQVAILAVGRARWRPLWRGDGFKPRLELGLTLGADHRVVDGADAAVFLENVVETLEAEW